MVAPALTLIVPAYNEGDRLAAGFDRLARAAAEGRLDLDAIELLYVDDGSTDETAIRCAELAGRLPNGRVLSQGTNRGKGAAVKAGVRAARAPRLIFTDADFAIDPRQIPSLLAGLDAAPIAVGSRTVRGHIDYGSRLRTIAGRGFNRLVRLVSSVSLADTQCGFKGLRTGEAKLAFHLVGIDGFAFDVELFARAAMLGFDVTEVPVSWSDVGGSHVRLATDSATMLVDLARARRRAGKLPSVLGLEHLGSTSIDELTAAVVGTPLEAAPLVELADERRVLLAPLLDPGPALASLRDASRRLGGPAIDLEATALRSLRNVTTLVEGA